MLVSRLKLRTFLFPALILLALFISSLLIINNLIFDDDGGVKTESPGSYLKRNTPKEDGSYCNFKYGLPEEFLYEESDLNYGPEENTKSPYRIIYDIIEGRRFDEGVGEITYASPMTVGFINYIPEIVRFWDGYVSVSIFVPDFDADLAIRLLDRICRCTKEMERVSVHFVFPDKLPPYLQNHQPEDRSCNLPDSSKFPTFRWQNRLKYPINVCRNSARYASNTELVLVADCELMPSANLAKQFVRMDKKFLSYYKDEVNPSRVYVVPVYEIDISEKIPRYKGQLVDMIREEKAVYFHRYVCFHCQKFPALKHWGESRTQNVEPFAMVKREHSLNRWEPIYIGTKNEPFYSEALSWEGLQDKMTQMDEMCLIGYKFVILDGAFLIHWPGIKKSKHHPSWRAEFRQENAQQYSRITKELLEKYDDNPSCKVGEFRTKSIENYEAQ